MGHPPHKFIAAFSVICLLCLSQGFAALFGLHKIDTLTRDLTGHTLPAARAITEMRDQMQTVRRAELASLLCTDSECLKRYPPIRATALEKYQSEREIAESLVVDEYE